MAAFYSHLSLMFLILNLLSPFKMLDWQILTFAVHKMECSTELANTCRDIYQNNPVIKVNTIDQCFLRIHPGRTTDKDAPPPQHTTFNSLAQQVKMMNCVLHKK